MLYERLPAEEKLNAFGFKSSDFDTGPTEIWPENWQAFLLFHGLQTQWRTCDAGLIGLDYNVLYKKLDRLDLSREEADRLEGDVCVMEFEALATLQEAAADRRRG